MSRKPEVAPRKGRSGPSGPSGVNKQPQIALRATAEEFELWRAAAEAKSLTLTQWIRDRCNRSARQHP